jgi:multicomponent Na+:H+ antiporter subunit B
LPLLAVPLMLALGLPLVVAVLQMPAYGEVNPALGGVGEHYNRHALAETGAVNIVTGIILDYRAYDTLIETTVLFCATMGVLLALRSTARRGRANGRRPHP